MSIGTYYSRPYEIGSRYWRLVVDGSPSDGYRVRWQWCEAGDDHWFDILCFPEDHPQELFDIACNQEKAALADYRLELYGDYPYPHFNAAPAQHPFQRMLGQNKRRRPRRS